MSSIPRPLRLLLRLARRTWPEPARSREGAQAARDFERDVGESEVGGTRLVWEVVQESCAIARAGLGLRAPAIARAAAEWASAARGDVRMALRGLRRDPSYAVVVCLTLALGIGANAGAFDVVDRVLFTPPAFERPDRLVFVWSTLGESADRFRVPAPDAAEIRDGATTLSSLAFVGRTRDGALEGSAEATAIHVRVATATPNLFDVLGVTPAIGRAPSSLAPSPTAPDGPPAASEALLSDAAWVRVFSGDPNVVGRSVRLGGRPVTVVGVLPVDFRLMVPPGTGVDPDADLWTPLGEELQDLERADGRLIDQDSDNSGAVVGRLAAGVGLVDVQRELDRLAADMRRKLPDYETGGVGLTARSLHADATAHLRGILSATLMGSLVLLVITCANVATLVVSRSERRSDELALRAALGASRGRIVRQLTTEVAVVIALGAGLAALTSAGLVEALLSMLPPEVSVAGGGRGLPMVAIATVIAGSVMLVFGLAPTVVRPLARPSGTSWLRTPGKARRDHARSALLVLQLALSIVLLSGSALLLRTTQQLRSVDPGFRADGALTFALSLRVPDRYRGPRERAALVQEINRTLAEIPTVTASGLSTHLPLGRGRWTQPYGLPGQAPHEWAENRADFRAVTSDLFTALGARFVDGRAFTSDEDIHEERRVVIVDEPLARRVAPTGSAIGRTIGIPLDGAEVEAEIVGVVERVRYDRLDADSREAVYVPYRQEASRDVSFVVRTDGDPVRIAASVRAALAEIDPQLAVYGLRTLDDYVTASVAPTRFAVGVLSLFAFLAFAAVGIGLYGVVALDLVRQRAGIGVKLALGATGERVIVSVVGRGLRLVAVGGLVGIALSSSAATVFGDHLFGTGLTDWRIWAAVLASVTVVTLLGCAIPASRATRIDPATAFRGEG